MAKVNTRIQSKHDVEKNWASATFAPLPGEIIIYDKDKGVDGGTHEKPRIKVGDGSTPVGSLPFVVDREATDAAIAEVDATVQGTIKDVSVSGKVLTFTKVDGTTVTATTQDTNTDTKVTNTKNNTAKAYITGTTTASTNTGTQVFDSTVYLDTEEGKLVAKKFQGKAMQDDLGNTISTTYETQADATEKLNTAKSYTDTKTANLNKEAYLTWGGRNISYGISPVAAAMSADHNANRLAFLNPAALSFETSDDGGSTWTSLSVSDTIKTLLVTKETVVAVGTASPVTTGNRTRMTLTAVTDSETYLYTRPRKMLINVATTHGLNVLVEYKTGVSGAAWQTLTDCTLSGNSSWNEIDFSSLNTFGGYSTMPSNNWYFRFTFYNTSVNTSYSSNRSSIMGIRLFGDTTWDIKNNLAKTGHLYSYDKDQNAAFPANVTATKFIGALQGKATSAASADTATLAISDEAGNNIVNTYATKASLDVEANPEKVIQATYIDTLQTTKLADITASPHNIHVYLDSTDGPLWAHSISPGTINSYLPSDVMTSRPVWTQFPITDADSMPESITLGGTDPAFNGAVSSATLATCYCDYNQYYITSGAVTVAADAGQNMYYLGMIFHSESTNKAYLLPMGSAYQCAADGGNTVTFYFDTDTGKLYVENLLDYNAGYSYIYGKHVYTNLPHDLKMLTMCYYGGSITSSCTEITINPIDQQGCDVVVLNGGDVIVNKTYYEEGNYLVEFPGVDDASNIYLAIDPATVLSYKASYLRDSGHVDVLKHIKECTSDNFEIEFNKIISTGRDDPSSDTPGLLYFKFL